MKIIAIILASGAALLKDFLEYKWHDKRTKVHKQVRFVLVLLTIVGGVIASALVIYDDGQLKKQIETAEINEGNSEKRESEAIKKLDALQEQIRPIASLAAEKYPTLDVTNALVKIARDVQDQKRQNEELQRRTEQLFTKQFTQLSERLNSLVKNGAITNQDAEDIKKIVHASVTLSGVSAQSHAGQLTVRVTDNNRGGKSVEPIETRP